MERRHTDYAGLLRVRREDLQSSDGSDTDDVEHDAELEAQINAQIAKALGLDSQSKSDAPPKQPEPRIVEDEDEAPAENDEDGYEFNLFSTGSSLPKIVLTEDPALGGDGAFLRPRPLSHYAVTEVSEQLKQEYAFAAISADDVYQRSQTPSWGLRLPWKVINVTATRKKKPGEDEDVEMLEEVTAEEKKKRPGKKARIQIRKRETMKEKQKEAAKKQKQEAKKKQEEKEEHIKDKKKRLNRIKKLRKRAKERERKLAAGEKVDDDADEGSSGAESGGEE